MFSLSNIIQIESKNYKLAQNITTEKQAKY